MVEWRSNPKARKAKAMIPQTDYAKGKWAQPLEERRGGPEVSDRTMADNLEEPTQHRASCYDVDHERPEGMMSNLVERKPYAVRLRMIILLSLLAWAGLLGLLALLIG